ncbi:MAG: hypothetical protein KGI38_00325 [Thaumarchaeota archaeon]|nr:hypothetical protein [Nitrososphaerota archaeon]
MNRNLLIFSLFLFFIGIAFGEYLVVFFGLLLLIPALLAPSRGPSRPVPVSSRQEVRRITPPPKPQSAVAAPTQPTRSQPIVMPAAPSKSLSYSPALFPTSMFPSLSMSGDLPQPSGGGPARAQAERDELVEAGAILALLRLLLA